MNLSNISSETWNFIIDHAEKLPQGVHLWYKGVPFPRRVYHSANRDGNFFLRTLDALGTVKKYIFALTFLKSVVIPRTLNVKKYEPFLQHIYLLFLWNLQEFLIKDDEYSVPVWETGKFIKIFLIELGFSEQLAKNYTQIAMMILEFDNAYRYRLQDMVGETTKELLANPRKEIKRLLEIYKQREVATINGRLDDEIGPRSKAVKVMILRQLLLVPRIKKAFAKALQEIDLEKIKLDENDRYHVSYWVGYNFFGQDFDTRYKVFLETHKNGFPPYYKRQNPETISNFLTGV